MSWCSRNTRNERNPSDGRTSIRSHIVPSNCPIQIRVTDPSPSLWHYLAVFDVAAGDCRIFTAGRHHLTIKSINREGIFFPSSYIYIDYPCHQSVLHNGHWFLQRCRRHALTLRWVLLTSKTGFSYNFVTIAVRCYRNGARLDQPLILVTSIYFFRNSPSKVWVLRVQTRPVFRGLHCDLIKSCRSISISWIVLIFIAQSNRSWSLKLTSFGNFRRISPIFLL